MCNSKLPLKNPDSNTLPTVTNSQSTFGATLTRVYCTFHCVIGTSSEFPAERGELCRPEKCYVTQRRFADNLVRSLKPQFLSATGTGSTSLYLNNHFSCWQLIIGFKIT